jgi:hypothetical protein
VVTLGQRILRGNGVYVHRAATSTELRVIAGTAALLAVAAILALGLGALLRRGTTAVTAAIVATVLPYLLALTVLPAGAAQWLLRITPAAAFALQQSTPQYAQVANIYTPVNGYFPLAPWAGFAVLAAWARSYWAWPGTCSPKGRMRQAPPAPADRREVLHAEWTKLRTAPGTIWLLLAPSR